MRGRAVLKVAALCASITLAGCGGGDPQPSLCNLDPPAMLAQVGALRGKPLAWSPVLAQASQGHAEHLAVTDTPSHTGAGGTTPIQRAQAAGWPSTYVGENLTVGPVDQAGALLSWENSPGHRVNLMNRNFTHMGAACVSTGKGYGTYWVQVLGKP